MRRWGGMLEEGEKPVPNKNIRLVIEWLDRYAEALPPLTVIGAAIPALETALDGALLRFLLDEVDDPVCGRCSTMSTATNQGISRLASRS